MLSLSLSATMPAALDLEALFTVTAKPLTESDLPLQQQQQLQESDMSWDLFASIDSHWDELSQLLRTPLSPPTTPGKPKKRQYQEDHASETTTTATSPTTTTAFTTANTAAYRSTRALFPANLMDRERQRQARNRENVRRCYHRSKARRRSLHTEVAELEAERDTLLHLAGRAHGGVPCDAMAKLVQGYELLTAEATALRHERDVLQRTLDRQERVRHELAFSLEEMRAEMPELIKSE